MIYIKTFNESLNKSQIEAICENYNIKNYTINDDGTIDVNDYVNLSNKQLKVLPLKFRNVSGNFYCHSNQLTSLEGAPKKVYGDFWCGNNKIKNIDYLPKKYTYLSVEGNPISKILNLFTKPDEGGWVSNTTDKELIMDLIDREIIQQDILLVNRLVEFLDDIDKPKSREELIELLKNDYIIR